MANNAINPVKIGIVGTGFGGRVQLPGFLKLEGVEIIALMSSGQRTNAENLAQSAGNVVVCSTFEELLSQPGLDAVSIVTPPYQHCEQTLAALKAGKHVLCEKPMAMNVDEARQMVDTCRSAGLVGMIDHEFRYVPARAFARELISEGWLGNLATATITLNIGTAADPGSRPWGWLFNRQTGGGFLGALGSHYLDALRLWFGDITAVLADTDIAIKERFLPNSQEKRFVTADDNFSLLCRFARGGRGIINVSAVARFGSGERMELYGDNGTLIIDSEGRLFGAKKDNDQLHQINVPARLLDGVSSDDQRLRPFARLASDFVDAIRRHQNGEAATSSPSPSFLDGLKVQQALDAARSSAETKKWVSLPPQ